MPLLRITQRRGQLVVSIVVGQQQDFGMRLAVRSWSSLVRRGPLVPTRPRFQNKDLRRHIARLGISE